MVAWRYEISSLMVEKIFHEWAQRTSEILFQLSKGNYVSLRGNVISSILCISRKYLWKQLDVLDCIDVKQNCQLVIVNFRIKDVEYGSFCQLILIICKLLYLKAWS